MTVSTISSVYADGIAYHPIQSSKSFRTKLGETINSLAINLMRPYWQSRELTLGSLVLPLSKEAREHTGPYLTELSSRVLKVALGVILFVFSAVPALTSSLIMRPLARSLMETNYVRSQASTKEGPSPHTRKIYYQNTCMLPGETPMASAALPNIHRRISILADTIRREKPDVVALSEMGPQASRELHSKLQDLYPDCFYDMGSGSGLTVLTKSEVKSHVFIPFNGVETPNGSTGFFILETADSVVCVSHLAHDTGPLSHDSLSNTREKQLRQVNDALSSYNPLQKPIYLVGDLGVKNPGPDLGRRLEYLTRIINNGFHDGRTVSAAPNLPSTATAWDTSHLYSHGKSLPLAITDYILVKRPFAAQITRVERTSTLSQQNITTVISNHEALIAHLSPLPTRTQSPTPGLSLQIPTELIPPSPSTAPSIPTAGPSAVAPLINSWIDVASSHHPAPTSTYSSREPAPELNGSVLLTGSFVHVERPQEP